ncbi:hypothetical protein MPSEU_000724300 [Mayamaea pseudoterrestris]|nr:hypothetical protein MPSEU_000079000 [Mayamaea pseudoterrestris]GKY97660.1 hypothetical protein MPSEU_000724300 [Mayamaea pseudoterrestris]
MNNVMMAQLMKDMQDPEMVREAQKLMKDPAFQAQMRTMMQAPQFQQAMQKTQDAMKDPEKLKELEEKAKQALEEGNKKLSEIESARTQDGDQKPAADGSDDIEDVPNLGLN